MNWYKIKLANKAHVAQLKVIDPFVKMLIMKYDRLIPWKNVKKQEQLIDFVEKTMLAEIQQRMDHSNPKNYYIKKIDVKQEFTYHPDDPEVIAAFEKLDTDPAGANKMLLDSYNSEKERSFKVWWDQINSNYANNPCFRYCVLDAVFNVVPSLRCP